jgi:YD repeat-containing protein
VVEGFDLLEEIGHGGMGVVYKARQRSLGRLVALKMIRPGADAEALELARFRKEAQTMAALQHPNIVQVHDIGSSGNRPFIAMELLPGRSLAQDLAGKPRSDYRKVASLVEVLARTMHAAHEQGIVHRDLKPGNVLFSADGTPKISDFGLAKRQQGDPNLTTSGAIVGTPSYMAPEQASGVTKKIGPAADVYALGAILYEMLTGGPPFTAETTWDILLQVMTTDPVPPRQIQPRVPRDLETICLKCLHKEPRRRYASAAELADDLERFLQQKTIRARPVGPLERGVKWVRRHPAPSLALILVVLLAGGAAVGAWLWRQGERQRLQKEAAEETVRQKEEAEALARKEETRYFAHSVYRHGAAQGVRELTPEQASRRQYTYRFFSRGGVVERVEQVNGHGQLSGSNPLLGNLAFLGQQQLARGPGVASWVFKRDANGTVAAEEMYDPRHQLVCTKHYTSASTAHFTYHGGLGMQEATAGYIRFSLTPTGLVENYWTLDRNSNQVPDASGAYGVHQDCDAHGLIVKLVFLNLQEQPVAITGGLAIVKRAYDEQTNQTEEAYFDAGEKPVRGLQGFHKKKMRYDEVGNCIEETYFGVDNRPIRDRTGIGGRRWQHSRHGDLAQEEYLDTRGQPAEDQRGVARWTAEYDERGHQSRLAYFAAGGQAATIFGGFSTMTLRHDERGRRTEERYFNAHNRPVRHWAGYHRMTIVYNEQGLRTEESYFDLDEKLAFTAAGYARRTMAYDEQGRIAQEAYFGTDGKPLVNANGFHLVKTRHDHLGRPSEGGYFGADGKPVLHRDGYHLVKRSHDEAGRPSGEIYFGFEGQPARHRNGFVRWERLRVAVSGQTLDGWRYFDAQGKPTHHKDGYLFCGELRDGRGNVTETAFMDAKGRVLHPDGYSYWKASYDPQGRQVERTYFDARDRLVANSDGYAVVRMKYDSRGHRTEETYFDSHKKPALCSKGFHRWSAKYDRLGLIARVRAYGLFGEPIRLCAVITQIVPGGPGERLGLCAGDVVLSCDGKEVGPWEEWLYQRLAENDSRTAQRMTLLRAGKKVEVSVPPGLLGIHLQTRAWRETDKVLQSSSSRSSPRSRQSEGRKSAMKASSPTSVSSSSIPAGVGSSRVRWTSSTRNPASLRRARLSCLRTASAR